MRTAGQSQRRFERQRTRFPSLLQKEAQEALGSLLEKLSLSARSFHRIMRVARTLADLAGDEEVGRSHVMKAIGFRRAL
ncbi:hypothetical protein AB9Q94_03935 [Neisseria gonorrhoeae]